MTGPLSQVSRRRPIGTAKLGTLAGQAGYAFVGTAGWRGLRGLYGRLRSLLPILLTALAVVPAPAMADEPLLDAQAAHAMSAEGRLTLVDVRTPPEWRADGRPDGAALVSLNSAGGRQAFLEGILDLVGGDRDRPLAMICNTGVRSSAAQAFLRRNGFNQVYDVAGGLHGSDHGAGWMAEGLPLEPCERC